MKPVEFEALLSALTSDRQPRVWSLLVTLFGDLAQDAEAQITGTTLSAITSALGIKPEAMRVALHRLRRDGWIESERVGRRSTYRLTERGRAESAGATPRIYATRPTEGAVWLVLSDPAGPDADAAEGVVIAPGLRLAPLAGQEATEMSFPIMAGHPLPAWMRAQLCPPTVADQARTLTRRLDALSRDLTAVPLDPAQVAALRVFVVHDWRRFVLRTPALPDHVFGPDWPGTACRAAVAEVLARLPRPPLSAFD